MRAFETKNILIDLNNEIPHKDQLSDSDLEAIVGGITYEDNLLSFLPLLYGAWEDS